MNIRIIYVGAHAGRMMVLHRKTGRKEFYNRPEKRGLAEQSYLFYYIRWERRSLDSFSGLFVSF